MAAFRGYRRTLDCYRFMDTDLSLSSFLELYFCLLAPTEN